MILVTKSTEVHAAAATTSSSASQAAAPVRKKLIAAPAQARQTEPIVPAAEAPKAKLVRDGFTMPEADFALIAGLKARALGARRVAKKSELLRAGLHALAALDAAGLVVALDRLEPVKTGRPKKKHRG